MPRIGTSIDVTIDDSIYYCTIKQFPKYLIFYRCVEGCIEIVRILHGARNWQELLEESE